MAIVLRDVRFRFSGATLFGVWVYCGADGPIFQDRILARLWGGDGLLLVAVYLLQRVDESFIPATERSRVGSVVMIITDGQRNAKFASPTYEHLSAGTQHCCQCLDADASGRLLQDQRIV